MPASPRPTPLARRRRRRALLPVLTVAALLAPLAPGLAGPAGAVAEAAPSATAAGDWPTWQRDARGSRHNAAETAITKSTVARLRLKWSFVFPFADGAQSSQPAVVGGTVYVGGRNSRFYALDAATGRQKWSFDVQTVAGPNGLQPNPLRDGPAVAGNTVYFGDSRGWLYALDTATGAKRWATRISTHPAAVITSSPLVHEGRVYVGTSSQESFLASVDTYECCTFRGSVVALDQATGAVVWRHWTVPEPQFTGRNIIGTRQFAPSGGAVWASPIVDPATDTVYVGTGQNYSGSAGDIDSLLAFDAATGAVRWRRQVTFPDTWNGRCINPLPGGNCPRSGPDFDIGATANLFTVGGRTVVGVGQKSSVYHVFDATTGAVVWQVQLNSAGGGAGPAAQNGIQWGSAYDGRRLYVATNNAEPGTLFALDPATGTAVWQVPNPVDGCTTGGALNPLLVRLGDCARAHISAPTTTPGLVYQGSRDGKIRVHDADTGDILWQYDTVRYFFGTNWVTGNGGSISGNGGPVVSGGLLLVNSGYQTAYSPLTGINGNVLLAFGL